jgi:hypothetical protein
MKIVNLTTKDLKKIVNRVINESMYARRRQSKIESFLEDALSFFDPLDSYDEFDFVSEVAQAVTDDLLTHTEDFKFGTKEWDKMFDEIYSFIRKHYYYKIQDHYDKVRTDY